MSTTVPIAPNATRAPLLDAAAGDELRALLAPVTLETFVRDYWARRLLFVKGFPEKYTGFFSREMFIRALAQPGPASPDFLRASFDKAGGARATSPPRDATELATSAFNATPEQAVPLFKAGATLCANQMEVRVPALAAFVGAVKRQLGYPGRVSFNAYLSPPRTGFNWHWDGRIASTLQIEGTKRWRFSNSSPVSWPRGNGALRADGSGYYVDGRPSAPWEEFPRFDEQDTTEVLLEPGDLLVLPAGVWHDACGGDGGSLALNLSFTPVSFTVLVRELLDRLLSSDAGWRGSAPVLPLPGGPPGEVDLSGLAAIKAQLTRAADALRSMAADDVEMVALWSSFVQATGLPPRDNRAPDAAPVAPGDRLRIRADRDVYARLADGGTRLCVFVGTGGRVDATGSELRLIQRILANETFVAGDCVAWMRSDASTPFTWDHASPTLTELLRQGVLERLVPIETTA